MYVLVQALTLAGLQGVADGHGAAFNLSKPFTLNHFEEDGALNVYAALGYLAHSGSRFASYINIGGPFLILGELFMRLAAGIGLVYRFPDTWLYLVYPDALTQAWKAFGVYKLLLCSLLPVSVWWLGNSLRGKRCGIVAAWIVTAMPFLPWFEARLKVDALCIALGLVSILHQTVWRETGREKSLYYGVFFLALSLSMKLIMAPGLLLLATLWLAPGSAVPRARGVRQFGVCVVIGLGVFFAANPFAISGLGGYLEGLLASKVFLAATPLDQDGTGGLGGIWFRLSRLDTFFGPALSMAAYPALGWSMIAAARKTKRALVPRVLLSCLLGYALYILVVAKALTGLAYYFFFGAVMIALLTACATDDLLTWLRSRGRLFYLTGLTAFGLCLAWSFAAQVDVVLAMLAPTSRQALHQAAQRLIEPGASVGVPLDGKGGLTTSFYRIDPFLYRVVPMKDASVRANGVRPTYLVLAGRPASEAPSAPPGYALIAFFDAARGLHAEREGLFQDEPFALFKAAEPTAIPPELPGGREAFLGQTLREDPDPGFNIVQYKALAILPQSLDLLRKQDEAVQLLPSRLMTASARQLHTAPAYLHQIDQTTLDVWGVKYILASLDASFTDQVLGASRFSLEEVAAAPPGSGREGAQAALFRNRGYRGQAFFAPDPPEDTRVLLQPGGLFGRHPVPLFGRFYDASALKRLGWPVVEISGSLETDGPVDLILKGADTRKSILFGAGAHQFRTVYEPGRDAKEIGYELNPVAPGTRTTLTGLQARPLVLDASPQTIQETSVAMDSSFVVVNAQGPGRVLMAVPYHPFWTAQVDGVKVPVERGPGDVVSVRVGQGRHVVSLSLRNRGGWR